VSCEQAFDPALRGRPVVVLSNNDGCIISRSNEAKRIGVPMGAPVHEVQPLLRKYRVAMLSSNYALYGDMSNRVMGLLGHYARALERYSVDECFLDLSGEPDPVALAQCMRIDVHNGLGLPICVGVAPSKTLAKIANYIAKKSPAAEGVFSFMGMSEAERLAVLDSLPVEEIWGVGRRLGMRLRLEGIGTAGALVRAKRDWLRGRFGVVLVRLADELSGISCLELETVQPAKKTLISTRSFGRKVTARAELEEAVSMHAAKLGEKLRKQGSLAAFIQVMVRTGLYGDYQTAQRDSEVVALMPPSNDSRVLIAAARAAVARLYRAGLRYHKAGACVFELSPAAQAQGDLFAGSSRNEVSERLMQTIDDINRKLGTGSLRWAAEGLKQPWAMRRNHVSPQYTTRWDQLLVVKAK
ncbi:MAG: Y-family DNA polymerase, partial [Burkholderiaceae bacterium]|nr:Y-family DNA polymerase [Burkholderiaceae bacterium]